MVLWGATTNGPTALPGTYQVRLTVDGKSQTQPFTVRKHPMHDQSDADMREQFELATADSRQGQRGQQCGDPDPQDQGRGEGVAREVFGRGAEERGRRRAAGAVVAAISSLTYA